MSANTDDYPNKSGIETEYAALRNEILKRIELRQQIISITLTLAGIFLSVGLSTESVVLIYPPLATFLAFGWAQNDFRIRHIATYIRTKLETTHFGFGYETYVQEARGKEKGLGAWRFVVISHSGIFLFTQLMAIAIEYFRFTFILTPLKTILLAVDAIAIVLVAWITTKTTR